MKHTAEQTHLYAVLCDPTRPLCVTEDVIEQFFGCVFFMCVCTVCHAIKCTGNQKQIVLAVADTLSRTRWEQIKSKLHFSDNTEMDVSDDKLFKIRPYFDSLSTKFNNIPMDEKLCVDEQIIPFKGKHRFKQYVKSKPKNRAAKSYSYVIRME
jgi:hypothetical protein